jgi:hypothetical protein
MNRRQRVAVVVGALVVLLLALFPPWVFDDAAFAEAEPWRLTHGPTFIFSPPAPAGAKDPLALHESSIPLEITGEELALLRGFYASAELDWATWLPHLAASLALTVAAVVVLKERKG